MKSKDTGRLGEKLAAGYLSRNGYKILDSNYHCRGGEVDIIAGKDGCLVFIELLSDFRIISGCNLEVADQ